MERSDEDVRLERARQRFVRTRARRHGERVSDGLERAYRTALRRYLRVAKELVPAFDADELAGL